MGMAVVTAHVKQHLMFMGVKEKTESSRHTQGGEKHSGSQLFDSENTLLVGAQSNLICSWFVKRHIDLIVKST
ncbi:putative zinc protease [Dissostichus eleginoides]|uniref:Zinc protease n=1 Tax=Dissostichus eleginoides TaxID=100907 RepID=A0AAD9C6X5_DISEL|nr:putative zinc protease [Dissostichus eleginoides]